MASRFVLFVAGDNRLMLHLSLLIVYQGYIITGWTTCASRQFAPPGDTRNCSSTSSDEYKTYFFGTFFFGSASSDEYKTYFVGTLISEDDLVLLQFSYYVYISFTQKKMRKQSEFAKNGKLKEGMKIFPI